MIADIYAEHSTQDPGSLLARVHPSMSYGMRVIQSVTNRRLVVWIVGKPMVLVRTFLLLVGLVTIVLWRLKR